jgi:hypothetical protein
MCQITPNFKLFWSAFTAPIQQVKNIPNSNFVCRARPIGKEISLVSNRRSSQDQAFNGRMNLYYLMIGAFR